MVLISSAYAQTSAPLGGGGTEGIILMVAMFSLLWFMMIRPQMKRAKEHRALIDAVQKGDEVVTSGGLIGRVTKVNEAYVSIEVADNIEIHMQKAAIQTLLPKGTIKSI